MIANIRCERPARMTLQKGFTLLELLVVMTIMVIMMGIAVAANFGITRGMAMRSAVDHFRSTLLHARQTAVLTGRKVYVLIDKTGVGSYSICHHEGTTTAVGGSNKSFWDDFGDLSVLVSNSVIYNLSQTPDKRRTLIKSVEYKVQGNKRYYEVFTEDPIWQQDDKYGWMVFPETTLPRGFEFSVAPDHIMFNGDGTSDQLYVVEICESMRANPGDPLARITVAHLTGFIKVEFDNF